MKKYKYISTTPCHFSTKIKGEAVEFSLYENEVYELPENSGHVKRLIALKLLQIQKPLKK